MGGHQAYGFQEGGQGFEHGQGLESLGHGHILGHVQLEQGHGYGQQEGSEHEHEHEHSYDHYVSFFFIFIFLANTQYNPLKVL